MIKIENSFKQRILDSALELAEKSSWEDIKLRDIASELEIPLLKIQKHYLQKDDLVEAWFDRADQAMLQLSLDGLTQMNHAERLHCIIFTWLDALAKHKLVTRQMLWYKLEPFHIHLQVLGLLRISRTVQWIRELAGISDRNLERIINEVGLTSVYLCTFTYWLWDGSKDQVNTRIFLERKLDRIENYFCKLEVDNSRQSDA